jgi:adenosylmethionine-8-amino-7-oxononanoate aminotransferase
MLEKAEKLFQTNDFAALIVEPLIQGSSGMRIYSNEWLDKLVQLAKKHNVIVIFDEVMTAWGRTGKLFAMNHVNELPDIVCLSKGLTGGVLPLGLTVTTQKIHEAFLSTERVKAFLHGHSFTGNPLACAAACASLDIFEQENTWKKVELISTKNKVFGNRMKAHTSIEDIRIMGTILAIELKTGEGNTYFSSKRDEAYRFFLSKGLLMRPLGNVIFINPPYSITAEELDYVYEVIEEFIG